MGKLAYLAFSFFLAIGSATFVAYTLAYTAHYYLNVPSPAIREQALISAALVFGFVTIQLLTTKD
jgi:hypothetical protein